jgi:hypothetical protein
MVAVLEENTTKEQRSVVRFCGQKDSMQWIFVKKCFLFTVRNTYGVKRFTTGSIKSLEDVQKSQTMPNQAQK